MEIKKEENKKEVQFIYCPECSSTGEKEKGKTCPNCSGFGLGSFLLGHFLYWGVEISQTKISLRKLKTLIDLIINLIVWLIVLAGLLSLAFYFWLNPKTEIMSALMFWNEKNTLVLSFWIGLFALLFIIYRMSQKKARAQRIRSIRQTKKIHLPNNWQELRRHKKKMDISGTFSDESLKVIEEAYLLAKKFRHREISSIHLFSCLLKTKQVAILFTRLNTPGKKLVDKLNNQLSIKDKDLKRESELRFSRETREILVQAFVESYNLNQKEVNVLNLIFFCIKKDEILKEILLELKVDEDKIKNTVEWFRINEKQVANYKTYRKLARFKPKTIMDRAYTAVATPLLNNFAYDLTLAAKWGRLTLCVAREKEIEAIFDSLKSGKNGILLTGPKGVGKKTIIEGIATEMVKEDVPKFLKDKRLIELDIARLISGADATEAGNRLMTILDEIMRAGNIILYIENLENIIGITSGGEESLELSEILANALERGAVYCLSSATNTNYIKYIENNAIGNTMDRLKIKEPMDNQAIQIIESKIGLMEAKHKVFFSYSALEAAISLTIRFIHDKYLPSKAIDVLKKTAVNKAAVCKKKGEPCICDKNDVAKTIHQITDIPVGELESKESKKLLNLETEIHKYMVNQEEAVDMVADSLRRARTQLREGKRPIASFLFMGPTGVGKTELAKTITRVYFKKKEYMIRLDMSEYQHEDSVKKMIGAPDSTGYLTEAVRQKPFSLILLDEFEKAHPKIFNLFLQVMDDGRLTDGRGKTIDFTNSIIIATSNAGSTFIQREVIASTPIEEIKTALINEHLNKVLRPELINRFDGIVVFKPLSRQNIIDITKLMLKGIARMLKGKGINLETKEEGVTKLAEEGYDPKFGARPLRRLLQKRVENEIAKQILAGNVDRRDTIIIDENAEIQVRKREEL